MQYVQQVCAFNFMVYVPVAFNQLVVVVEIDKAVRYYSRGSSEVFRKTDDDFSFYKIPILQLAAYRSEVNGSDPSFIRQNGSDCRAGR
jgi:hypothetical protein